MRAKILVALALVMGLAVTSASAQIERGRHDRDRVEDFRDNRFSTRDGKFYNDDRFFYETYRRHLSRRERRRLMRERRMAMRRYYWYKHHRHSHYDDVYRY